jgi:hypothetical protein
MPSERHLVFLDADVLAAPLTRSVILMAVFQEGSGFGARWSLAAEAEADKHARPGQMRLGGLRQQFEWADRVIVPNSDGADGLKDTEPGDWHIIDAAHQAGITVIMTRNVHHFGSGDLAGWSMSAVHPDQWLATVLTPSVYEKTLTDICANRRREPKTPAKLHAALAKEHPRLFAAMAAVFPGVGPEKSDHSPPAEVFRGVRCIKCQDETASANDLVDGVGPNCRAILIAPS